MSRTIPVKEIRAELRRTYKTHPDDSHGEGYRNWGIETAIAIVNRLTGDVDFEAQCESDDEGWCLTHHAYRDTRKWCGLAQAPWKWAEHIDWTAWFHEWRERQSAYYARLRSA